MTDWQVNVDAAAHVARTLPRDPRHPPHWLRCAAVREHEAQGIVRCALGDGHPGEHQEPK